MKKFGFTLAEILVSVAIVGVMAALTLPTLRTNTTNAQIGPKLAKAVSTFEQANESLLSSMSSDSLSDAGLINDPDVYIRNLRNFLKITSLRGDNTFVTKDNMVFQIVFNDEDDLDEWAGLPVYRQEVGNVIVCLNVRKENEDEWLWGTDTFAFSFWNDGSLRPWGGTNWNEEATSADGGILHWKTLCPINGVAPAGEDAAFCTGHIFENNLRVLYE